MKSKDEIELEEILKEEGLKPADFGDEITKIDDITMSYDSAPEKSPLTPAERAKRHREKAAEERNKERAAFENLARIVDAQRMHIAELQDRHREFVIKVFDKLAAVEQLQRESAEFRGRIATLEHQIITLKDRY